MTRAIPVVSECNRISIHHSAGTHRDGIRILNGYKGNINTQPNFHLISVLHMRAWLTLVYGDEDFGELVGEEGVG